MSCLNLLTIDREQCIGNSRDLINENFVTLQNGICENRDRITELEGESATRLQQITEITNIAVPGSAKAWVSFKGNDSSRFPLMYASYNIDSVQRRFVNNLPQAGVFQIDFLPNVFTNSNYVAIGTSTYTNNQPTWVLVSPIPSPTVINITVVRPGGIPVDADRVSLVFF